MDSNLIIDAVCLEQTSKISGNYVFPNTYLGRYEADIFEITKHGYLSEYEVKISHSDFLAEKKKLGKRDILLSGKRCNYFIYLCPDGIIPIEEVPEYAGLYYISDISHIKSRKIGNYSDQADWEFPKLNIKVMKSPKKISTEKLGNIHLSTLMKSTYRRFHQRTIWNKYTIKKQ